ncbi:ATP synthase subunit I [Thalassotalea agarivorans]|uniref:ATP synthase protein I n=1 Tax=Thalassotalea agarivorans TaxID=349064 RepID=A0A1I0GBU6_THASX|nr:ATP synthase subunit I [Thalassotalea agarivorans]SET68384.1 ATP synthase protein I [Thalassotalea agarivorans]
MANKLVQPGRKFAIKQILIALLVTVLCSVINFIYWGTPSGQSALIGGFVAIIPSIIFAYKAFQFAGASASKKVIDAFFMGEKLKLVLTAVLFAISFRFFSIEPIPFFATYFLTLVAPMLLAINNKFTFN